MTAVWSKGPHFESACSSMSWIVRLADTVLLKGEFMRSDCCENLCEADINDDCKVNLNDLVIMKMQFMRADCPARFCTGTQRHFPYAFPHCKERSYQYQFLINPLDIPLSSSYTPPPKKQTPSRQPSSSLYRCKAGDSETVSQKVEGDTLSGDEAARSVKCCISLT